jgi:hypothetical protein
MSATHISPLLSKKQTENLVEYTAIRDAGSRIKIGGKYLIPQDQVLYYYTLGWIQVEAPEVKRLIKLEQDLIDHQQLQTEQPSQVAHESLTLAEASANLEKSLEGKMVPKDEVQKMIEHAVKTALEEAKSKSK